MRICIAAAFLAFATCSFGSASETFYFGDTFPTKDVRQSSEIEFGLQLFIKVWKTEPWRRNRSCVSCHKVPMPGGSGMASTRTSVRRSDLSPSGFQVVNENERNNLKGKIGLRTPPLFGIGILEQTACNAEPAPCQHGRLGYLQRIQSLEAFVKFALESEIGVLSIDQNSRYETASQEDIKNLAAYVRALAPPPVETLIPLRERAGYQPFVSAKCDECHTPSVNILAPLGNRSLPFSDLKIHNIRSGSSYGVRTAPLWGNSYTGPPYMHDGSAASILEAITLHSGEASPSTEIFGSLSAQDKASLIKFISDL